MTGHDRTLRRAIDLGLAADVAYLTGVHALVAVDAIEAAAHLDYRPLRRLGFDIPSDATPSEAFAIVRERSSGQAEAWLTTVDAGRRIGRRS